MSGLIIRNQTYMPALGVPIESFKSNPKLALDLGPNGDGAVRASDAAVTMIILHTTKGADPQVVLPGFGANVRADEKVAKYWSTSKTRAGAHLVIDADGSIACLCDLAHHAAFHAGNNGVNRRSIGIEIYQGSKREVYFGQLEVAVKLVDFLTKQFVIQRQIPHEYNQRPLRRLVAGGADIVGVFGHRDVTANRGSGDPSNKIFDLLRAAGYEKHDFAKNADKEVWKTRQQQLGVGDDGIPGPKTAKAIAQQYGYKNGLWVKRPGD